MPTGLPDSPDSPQPVETTAERLVREAMEAGDFDDLPGEGAPIPGAGKVDDDLWWVRSWLERNRDPSGPEQNLVETEILPVEADK
jgi:hypothetical protein